MKACSKTKEYEKLKMIYNKTDKLGICGPYTYDYSGQYSSLVDTVEIPLPFSHNFVLMGMLENDLFWNRRRIIHIIDNKYKIADKVYDYTKYNNPKKLYDTIMLDSLNIPCYQVHIINAKRIDLYKYENMYNNDDIIFTVQRWIK